MARKSKKFVLIRDEAGIFKPKPDFFEGIQSRNEALVIAMRTYNEINNSLLQEYEEDGDLKVSGQLVTEALQQGLNQLELKYPCLMIELLSTTRYLDGKVLTYFA